MMKHREAFHNTTFTPPEDRCHHFTGVLLRYVDTDYPLRVLDIGCGTGEQLFELAEALPAAILMGVDLSAANIQMAETRRVQHPCAERVVFTAQDYLTLKTSAFDVILADSTLHHIDVPAARLFDKLAHDLQPGGLLFNSMPYACLYNHVLWTGRRVVRAIRCPLTDAAFLYMARILHRRQFSDVLLRQRIHYMYLLPHCYDRPQLTRLLEERFGLQPIGKHAVPHTSVAQPKHRLTVFRRRG